MLRAKSPFVITFTNEYKINPKNILKRFAQLEGIGTHAYIHHRYADKVFQKFTQPQLKNVHLKFQIHKTRHPFTNIFEEI